MTKIPDPGPLHGDGLRAYAAARHAEIEAMPASPFQTTLTVACSAADRIAALDEYGQIYVSAIYALVDWAIARERERSEQAVRAKRPAPQRVEADQ